MFDIFHNLVFLSMEIIENYENLSIIALYFVSLFYLALILSEINELLTYFTY